MIDMSHGNADPDGWQYSFNFTGFPWVAHCKLSSSVRRRRWIRFRRTNVPASQIPAEEDIPPSALPWPLEYSTGVPTVAPSAGGGLTDILDYADTLLSLDSENIAPQASSSGIAPRQSSSGSEKRRSHVIAPTLMQPRTPLVLSILQKSSRRQLIDRMKLEALALELGFPNSISLDSGYQGSLSPEPSDSLALKKKETHDPGFHVHTPDISLSRSSSASDLKSLGTLQVQHALGATEDVQRRTLTEALSYFEFDASKVYAVKVC
jgi:hypothetical protein